jgi:aspartate/methionine/tyrosine aminotransferase
MENLIQTSKTLREVKYEIRGQLAHRADELEKRGYEVISLNIGNPGLFGFRTPETMRLAMIENLGQAEPYCHQKGIFPAREAVVMQQQDRGFQSIKELVRPGGRLYQSRQAVIDCVAQSRYLSMQKPMGAMYAFIKLDDRFAGKLDDRAFALELLEDKHILVAPGSSFNTPYSDHFRITTLPDNDTIDMVFDRIESLLEQRA